MNSDLFVQVVAQIATAAVPNSVLQYLKAGQITKLEKHTGGHRPLLMMSFLRRMALKSVMAATKESVAMCAGPLQYSVGKPDGANTMIKTITSRKLTPPESLLLLTSKLPSRMSLGEPCCTVSSKPMRILLLSSPSGTPAPQSTGCTTILPAPKSVPTAVDQGCPLSTCGFSAGVDPVLRSTLADICRHYDPGAKLFAYLDDWYLDQTAVPTADSRHYHRSHQISQPRSTVHQDTGVERLLPGPHST